MTTTTLNASWLIPQQSHRSRKGRSRVVHGDVVLMPAGVLWDAVRTPLNLGMPVLGRLLAHEDDAELLGPVLADRMRGWLYWLISPGCTDDWPDWARLLGADSWLGAPTTAFAPTPDATWLHLPDQRIVSGPAWLAAALWDDHLTTAA